MPCPVEPALAGFKDGHLRLGVGLEVFLVAVGIAGWVGVGAGAGAWWAGVSGWAVGGIIVGIEGPFPAGAAADVVKEFGAVSVCLGPFAAHGWAPSIIVSWAGPRKAKGERTLCWCC